MYIEGLADIQLLRCFVHTEPRSQAALPVLMLAIKHTAIPLIMSVDKCALKSGLIYCTNKTRSNWPQWDYKGQYVSTRRLVERVQTL